MRVYFFADHVLAQWGRTVYPYNYFSFLNNRCHGGWLRRLLALPSTSFPPNLSQLLGC